MPDNGHRLTWRFDSSNYPYVFTWVCTCGIGWLSRVNDPQHGLAVHLYAWDLEKTNE